MCGSLAACDGRCAQINGRALLCGSLAVWIYPLGGAALVGCGSGLAACHLYGSLAVRCVAAAAWRCNMLRQWPGGLVAFVCALWRRSMCACCSSGLLLYGSLTVRYVAAAAWWPCVCASGGAVWCRGSLVVCVVWPPAALPCPGRACPWRLVCGCLPLYVYAAAVPFGPRVEYSRVSIG